MQNKISNRDEKVLTLHFKKIMLLFFIIIILTGQFSSRLRITRGYKIRDRF